MNTGEISKNKLRLYSVWETIKTSEILNMPIVFLMIFTSLKNIKNIQPTQFVFLFALITINTKIYYSTCNYSNVEMSLFLIYKKLSPRMVCVLVIKESCLRFCDYCDIK
jgi:hypothetical protein